MKRILKIIRKIIWVLLIIFLLLFALIQIPFVQTQIAGIAAHYLSKELQTEVHIEGVSFSLPNRVKLKGVYLEDQEGDTLAFIQSLHLAGFNFDQEKNHLRLGDLKLEEPKFFLHRHQSDSMMNLNFITEYFSSEDTTSSNPFSLDCKSIDISNGAFVYYDFTSTPAEEGLVDFSNLDIRGFNLLADTVFLLNDSVSTFIHKLNLVDHSGFHLNSIVGAANVSSLGIDLEGGHIETNGSKVNGHIVFNTNSWSDWSDFNTQVKMRSKLDSSEVDFEDLAYFVPEFKGLERKVEIEGKIRGSVSRLRGKDITLKWDDNSRMEGDFRFEGLPDFEQTFITLDLKRLTTNKTELDRFPLPPFDEKKFIQTPDNIAKLGQLEFSGSFTGFISEFVAYGRLDTRIGRIRSDLSFKEKDGTYEYSGDLATEKFDLGKFYDEQMLGVFSSELKVDGIGLTVDDADAELNGAVTEFFFNDYLYRNISVNGSLRKAFFDGKLAIEDSNVKLDFLGTIDFSTKKPIIKAEAELPYFDPVALHFLEDSVYTSLNTNIVMNIKGLDVQTFTGSILADNFSYCRGQDEYNFDKLELIAKNVDNGRSITLNSPVADLNLKGKYNFSGIKGSVLNILDQVFPSYIIPEYELSGGQNFTARLTVKDFTPISELFIPELDLAPGTFMDLQFDEVNSKVDMILSSDRVRIYDYTIDSLTFDISRPEEAAYITILSDKVQFTEKLALKSFDLEARSENDTIYSAISWNSSDMGHSGEINSRFNLRGNENFDILFSQSRISLNDTSWTIKEDSFIQLDSTLIRAQNFAFEHGEQFIRANGSIATSPDSILTVDIKDFNLNNLNPFFSEFNSEISGTINGSASIKDLYGEKKFLSDIIVEELAVNQTEFGSLSLESSWDTDKKRLVMVGEIQKNKDFPLQFGGYYTPSDEVSPLDLDLSMEALELSFLNPLLSEGISSLSGTLDANARLTGTLEEPLLDGEVIFNEVGITIDYLGTTYYLNDKAGIYPDMFTLDYIEFKDMNGNVGHLIGTVAHTNFSKWNFDVYAELDRSPMMVLNTTKEQNPLYYGKAYATGFVSIFGFDSNLEFDINLKAEKGTLLELPLGDPEELAFEDFVVFVNTEEEVEEEVDLSGIDLHFELDITPDAEFRLIFDEAAGDVIKGRGQGHLVMDITSAGIFEMFGTLEVVEGDYLFTLRNLISKPFKVERGGTISWYGDPTGAELDLRAVYKLSAPLFDLMAGERESYKNRVPVDLYMNLKGPLLNPGITFDIELPNSDELTRNRVESVLITEEEINRQAFALLVLRRFVSPPSIQNEHNSLGVAENSVEFLTSQFNNWLSQISEDFDIGFNYRPGDEITNSEVALALSTQLFNERLNISGNFGVNYGNSAAGQNANNLVGDVNIEYNITEDGKIRMIAYNRTNEYDITQTDRGLNTQGLGIVYEEEFDTLDEFFCQLKQLFRPNDKRIPCDD